MSEIKIVQSKFKVRWFAKVYEMRWHKEGDSYFLHREDGPAWIAYRENGSKIVEKYYIDDKLHREDGPAYIQYNKDESIKSAEYYLNGVELSREEWLLRVDPLYKELV